MPVACPDTTDSYSVGPHTADRLWDWLLRRQGLGADRLGSVPAIASASLGLHAARVPSPFATVLARAGGPSVALSLWHPATHRDVTTIRCMRKTLHTLPLDLAAAAHAATLHYRERDAMRQLRNAGVPERLADRTMTSIQVLLAEHGHLTHRQIEAQLAVGSTTIAVVRLALKLGWERGALTYRNRSGGWNREYRTFALTATAHPGLDLGLDRDAATNRLIEVYFDRYGPASLRDAMWWSGLSRSAVLAGLAGSGRPLVEVRAPWSAVALYMYRDRLEEFERAGTDEAPAEPHFLAHEDVALKAYAETRSRYLGSLDERRAFNQIGEALPTVVISGKVVGVWRWDTSHSAVSYTLFRDRVTGEQLVRIRQGARSVSTGLRQGYAEGGTRDTPASR